ncbi:13047_t:CDS:2, partial [Dentiscutata erythropus]
AETLANVLVAIAPNPKFSSINRLKLTLAVVTAPANVEKIAAALNRVADQYFALL